MNGNEVDKFFEGLPTQDKKVADVFDEKNQNTPTQVETAGTPEEGEEPRKNRRHRRLEEQLQRERESNIALNERIRAISEAQQFIRDTQQGNSSDIDPRLIETFGDTDAGKKVAKHFSEILREEITRAKEETIQEFESRQQQVIEEQKQYEATIDAELEHLEDEYDVDLTSNAPSARKARREFLEMVQALSPKDENGVLTGYADFESTFNVYQQNQSKPDASRNKEIASRTMQRSGGSNVATNQQPTPGFRGWQKDYNVQ